ncbi:MAG: arginine--tRNA ligase [Hyphomicrobiaceae bacterium]
MNVFKHVEGRVIAALEALKSEGKLPADLSLAGVEVDSPRDKSHGDLATNAALVLTKRAGMKPRDIATLLQEKLSSEPGIAKIDIAGPGFLNLTFAPAFWHSLAATIITDGNVYGRSTLGSNQKINVEYVSANPTGPMHVGHCRGAVFGDTLANLLAFAGFSVTREYYINDAGGQVDNLARSAHLRYREALGETIGEIPEGLYPGEYLKPVGEALAKTYKKKLLTAPESEWLPKVKATVMAAMMDEIRADLAQLGIKHDLFFSERSLTDGKDEIADTIADLRTKGFIYEGSLPPPKGEPNDDWEDRTQTLFKATAFGDDIDRALQKADGSYTYLAGDIAYHRNKLNRGYDALINVWGSDHKGYVKRMQAAVQALSDNTRTLDIKISEMVNLLNKGEPVKMSKRAGNIITVRDVVDAVGPDAVRFMMVYRAPETVFDFDYAKVTEQSKENPVFYVQYANARISSVLRNARDSFPALTADSKAVRQADLTPLTDSGELALIKTMAEFPRVIDAAARAKEPHRLAFYLYELASSVHGQWTRGNDSPHLRFIQADENTTAARLSLLIAVRQVITSGLGVLGVQAPEAMR